MKRNFLEELTKSLLREGIFQREGALVLDEAFLAAGSEEVDPWSGNRIHRILLHAISGYGAS